MLIAASVFLIADIVLFLITIPFDGRKDKKLLLFILIDLIVSILALAFLIKCNQILIWIIYIISIAAMIASFLIGNIGEYMSPANVIVKIATILLKGACIAIAILKIINK